MTVCERDNLLVGEGMAVANRSGCRCISWPPSNNPTGYTFHAKLEPYGSVSTDIGHNCICIYTSTHLDVQLHVQVFFVDDWSVILLLSHVLRTFLATEVYRSLAYSFFTLRLLLLYNDRVFHYWRKWMGGTTKKIKSLPRKI